jgi:uncharacterized membrane protein
MTPTPNPCGPIGRRDSLLPAMLSLVGTKCWIVKLTNKIRLRRLAKSAWAVVGPKPVNRPQQNDSALDYGLSLTDRAESAQRMWGELFGIIHQLFGGEGYVQLAWA